MTCSSEEQCLASLVATSRAKRDVREKSTATRTRRGGSIVRASEPHVRERGLGCGRLRFVRQLDRVCHHCLPHVWHSTVCASRRFAWPLSFARARCGWTAPNAETSDRPRNNPRRPGSEDVCLPPCNERV